MFNLDEATHDDNEKLTIHTNEGRRVLMQSFSNDVGRRSSSQVVALAAHMILKSS